MFHGQGMASDVELQISSVKAFNRVVFKEHAGAPLGRKFTSLFPGLGYAAGYKVRWDWDGCNWLIFCQGSATNLQVRWPAFRP